MSSIGREHVLSMCRQIPFNDVSYRKREEEEEKADTYSNTVEGNIVFVIDDRAIIFAAAANKFNRFVHL